MVDDEDNDAMRRYSCGNNTYNVYSFKDTI
jgi:hypothetical protein